MCQSCGVVVMSLTSGYEISFSKHITYCLLKHFSHFSNHTVSNWIKSSQHFNTGTTRHWFLYVCLSDVDLFLCVHCVYMFVYVYMFMISLSPLQNVSSSYKGGSADVWR